MQFVVPVVVFLSGIVTSKSKSKFIKSMHHAEHTIEITVSQQCACAISSRMMSVLEMHA